MFRPVNMSHVLIEALRSDLPQLALELARSGAFHPDHRSSDEHELTHIPGEEYRQLYHAANSRVDKISAHWAQPVAAVDDGSQVPDEAELASLNDKLGELWSACSDCQEQLRRLDAEQHLVDQLESTLAKFANLNVDLSLLQGEKHFLVLRIGSLPRSNDKQLEEALGLAGFLVYPFLTTEQQIHVVVLGARSDRIGRVDRVLESAGFHDLPIPAELQDQPDKVSKALALRRARLDAERDSLEQRIAGEAMQHYGFLADAKRALALAEPYVLLGSAARSSSQLAVVSGWVPTGRLAGLERQIDAVLPNAVRIDARRPRMRELPWVPTLLSPNRLLSPFTALVTQYGVPRYGEIDPSSVFAATFVLMFGMMFGDVGHGAVILLTALLLRHRLGKFTLFGVSAGLSSAAFGAVYGSVFGFEELLHPLWLSPLSDPTLLLEVALGWGVGFLLLMTAMSIYNRLTEGDWQRALLGSHGLVSIGLYLGLLWGGWNAYRGAGFGPWPTLLVAVALAALAGYKWVTSTSPPAERLMVVAVETFETITGNLSATLSFLRVAAFSLNHVALAIAVFTLAGMLQPLGHWLMVIFGNIFILVLEGAIVTIQALRLEYYEGFTRFYAGDGHAFSPLPLNLTPAATGKDHTYTQQGVTA
jgi:V/A-type H+-transporting ATPase subunit I